MALESDFKGVLIGCFRTRRFVNNQTGEVRDAQWVAQVMSFERFPLEGPVVPLKFQIESFYLPNQNGLLIDWVLAHLGRGVSVPVDVRSSDGRQKLYPVKGADWKAIDYVIGFPGGVSLPPDPVPLEAARAGGAGPAVGPGGGPGAGPRPAVSGGAPGVKAA